MVGDVRYAAQNSKEESANPVKSNKERAWASAVCSNVGQTMLSKILTIQKQQNDTEGLCELVEMNECSA